MVIQTLIPIFAYLYNTGIVAICKMVDTGAGMFSPAPSENLLC